MDTTFRIDKLRKHALDARIDLSEWNYYFEKGYIKSNSNEVHTGCRFALASQYMLEHVKVVIDDDELLVGKPSCRDLDAEEAEQWALIQQYSQPAKPSNRGQSAHMAVDFELLLEKGALNIIADIKNRMEKLDVAEPEQVKKHEFYRSCVIALEGLIAFADRYAAHAKALAESCADETRKQELLTIANICAKVPAKPAEGFYEAIQSAHFLNFILTDGIPSGYPYQLGRPDRFLYKYYKKDIDSGAITKAFAQELLDCLGIIFNEYLNNGSSIGYMVGGRDENGNNVENELTHMCIQSVEHVGMVYPAVGLGYNADTSDELLNLSCEILSKGHSHPALFNDDVIIKGLIYYGLPYKEACSYIHSACVEITPIASSASWVASPYVNLLQLLLDTIDAGVCDNYGSYKEFEQAYYDRLAAHIRQGHIEQNAQCLERTLHFHDPLTSCFVNDCIERGVDIESGGARYNWIMPSFVGLSNVANSLHTINEFVYTQNHFSLSELKVMLEKNFEGFDALRSQILNKLAKYGNDDENADAYIAPILDVIKKECSKYTTIRGGKVIPSLFCWIMHEQLGSQTMATPDGRKCGFPLGDGSGPTQGSEKNGPTASVLSSTKWEHHQFIGGIAVNMKFSKKMFTKESVSKLSALIKTFMERGGFELQINVVDKETLLKAQENPEQYADLVVRIGGYSDFFVRLSRNMQQEVIERSEHTI